MDYIWYNLLPAISLWSRILLDSLQKHNKNINDQKLLSYADETIFDMSLTNCYAEEYFSIIKQNKRYVNMPVVEFIRRHYTTVLGLRRQMSRQFKLPCVTRLKLLTFMSGQKKDIKN